MPKKQYHIDGFSDRLQLAIGKSGLLTKDISAEIHSDSLLRKYLNDECYPTAINLIRLCKLLHCSADWLLGLGEVRNEK